MKHTPTPYEIHGATLIWSPTGKQMVATASEPEPKNGSVSHEKVELLSQNFNLACANAAFIVKACNMHDELVEALKEAIGAIGSFMLLPGYNTKNTGMSNILHFLEAALAKAEVKE